jgi:NlpE N-terminal domain/NlpE C-terminal OB domain
MTRRLAPFFALVAALAGGCGRDSRDATDARTPMPATIAGVYAGEFPCSNCAVIEATLWLRPDGRFFFRQRFVDDTANATAGSKAPALSVTHGLGRWSWDAIAAEIVLRSVGPERRLSVRDEQHLELRVASPLEHVLVRDAKEPRFADRFTLDGESAVTESGATFKECLTGLTFRVVDAGAYNELRRWHGRMRGQAALTTVEGHLVTVRDKSTTSERLVVDAFVAIKPGTGC